MFKWFDSIFSLGAPDMTRVVVVIYPYFKFRYSLASSNVLKTIGDANIFNCRPFIVCYVLFKTSSIF